MDKTLVERYNVTYTAIHTTGIGQGVYQLVKQFYPRVVAINYFNYSPEAKGRLVLKGLSVVGNGRLQFDAGWTDMAQSFMAIRRTMTASGRRVSAFNSPGKTPILNRYKNAGAPAKKPGGPVTTTG